MKAVNSYERIAQEKFVNVHSKLGHVNVLEKFNKTITLAWINSKILLYQILLMPQ
jgi:hypothetical protein